jgi:predicted nucleic acid-binding protein
LAGYVLDTSAVMAILLDEDGADLVRDVIFTRGRVILPFIVKMEVEYKYLQERPDAAEESIDILENWPVEMSESYYSWGRASAGVKALGKISLADAWVASLALLADAELVHKDPEFDAVPDLKHLRLPYRARRPR